MSDTVRVAIAGASGYVGGELLRLLTAHPRARLGALAAGSRAGDPVERVHPHLAPLAGRRFAETSPATLADHDVVFLALPHGHSAQLAAALPPETLVLDCGADHRLRSEDAWAHYYGGAWAGAWPYGLPELPGARAALRDARRIAVPGCYPTAATLAFAPLLAAGLAEPDVVVVAASGVSGAGATLAPHLLGAVTMGSVAAYGVGGVHRHTPEITQNLQSALDSAPHAAGAPLSVSFTPLLAPMPRGILATVSAPARAGVTHEQLRSALAEAYGDEPFVSLLPEDTWPTTGALLGSNAVQVAATLDPLAGRVVALAALDNLVKGAAGQAVQCMNLALGLPEDTGLASTGIAP